MANPCDRKYYAAIGSPQVSIEKGAADKFRKNMLDAFVAAYKIKGYAGLTDCSEQGVDLPCSTAEFPGYKKSFGSRLAIMVRPVDNNNGSIEESFSVPIITGDTVSLRQSRILSRRIGYIRMSNKFDRDDGLIKTIDRMSQSGVKYNRRNMMVDMTCHDWFMAISEEPMMVGYQDEITPLFENVNVTQATAIIPIDPDNYATHGCPVAVYTRSLGTDMTYAYGLGSFAFRGMPVAGNGFNHAVELPDYNVQGETSFFNFSDLHTMDQASLGNFVVVGFPFYAEKDDEPKTHELVWDNTGNNTKPRSTRVLQGGDVQISESRKVTIVDIKPLLVTPDQIKAGIEELLI